jgi:hypothetical protein
MTMTINGIPYPSPLWIPQPRFNPTLSGSGVFAGVAAGNQPGTARNACALFDNNWVGASTSIANGVSLGTTFPSGSAPTNVPVQLSAITLIQNQAGG